MPAPPRASTRDDRLHRGGPGRERHPTSTSPRRLRPRACGPPDGNGCDQRDRRARPGHGSPVASTPSDDPRCTVVVPGGTSTTRTHGGTGSTSRAGRGRAPPVQIDFHLVPPLVLGLGSTGPLVVDGPGRRERPPLRPRRAAGVSFFMAPPTRTSRIRGPVPPGSRRDADTCSDVLRASAFIAIAGTAFCRISTTPDRGAIDRVLLGRPSGKGTPGDGVGARRVRSAPDAGRASPRRGRFWLAALRRTNPRGIRMLGVKQSGDAYLGDQPRAPEHPHAHPPCAAPWLVRVGDGPPPPPSAGCCATGTTWRRPSPTRSTRAALGSDGLRVWVQRPRQPERRGRVGSCEHDAELLAFGRRLRPDPAPAPPPPGRTRTLSPPPPRGPRATAASGRS